MTGRHRYQAIPAKHVVKLCHVLHLLLFFYVTSQIDTCLQICHLMCMCKDKCQNFICTPWSLNIYSHTMVNSGWRPRHDQLWDSMQSTTIFEATLVRRDESVWYKFVMNELKLPITCNVFVMMKHFTVINQQKSQTCCVYLNIQKLRLLALRVSSEKF